jgi:membrane protein required for colicin V production
MTFDLFDIALIFILLVFVHRGFKDGFILSLIQILVLLISIFFAIIYTTELKDFLVNIFPMFQDATMELLSFGLLFLGIFFVLGFLSKLLKIINIIPLIGQFNQAIGAILGLAKGSIIISLLMFFMTNHLDEDLYKEYVAESKLYPVFESIAPGVYNFFLNIVPIGENFYEEFNKEIKKNVDEQLKKI